MHMSWNFLVQEGALPEVTFGASLQVFRLCTNVHTGNRRALLASPQRMRQPERRCTWMVRAEGNSKTGLTLDVKKLGVVPFDDDCETFMDAMAFTGPAPEVGCNASRCRDARNCNPAHFVIALASPRLKKCTCCIRRGQNLG